MATALRPGIQPAIPLGRTRARRGLGAHHAVAIETAALMLVFGVAYSVLGHRVVVGQHVVIGDALSRLAHAYYAWHNDPPKLAAIGFAWPPVQTLAYLPLGIVKPLATSLTAMPVYSAFFGAATIAVINRGLALLEMRRALRWPLLLAFGLNPMWAWYSANGMSETPYLFLLTAAMYFFLRYYLTNQHHQLMLVGVCLGLGFLTRYELLAWVALISVAVFVVLVRRHRSRDELEGSLLAFLVPVVFAVMMWCFFSFLIVGDPFFWFKDNFGANLSGSTQGTARVAEAADTAKAITPGLVLGKTVLLNLQLFLPTLLMLPVLLAASIVRRDLGGATLAAAGALNALLTALLVFKAQDLFLLQLRYNMRAMPLVVLGLGYLVFLARGRLRTVAWAVSLVALVVAIPLTWNVMANWPDRYYEGQFVKALTTGADLEGTSSRGGYFQKYGLGIAPEKRMAARVNALVGSRKNRVLTDDRWSFGVLLASGHPERFLDRVDKGDGPFRRVLNHPRGRVDYVLVSRSPVDLVNVRYRGLLRGREPGFERVLDTGPFVLFRVR